MRNLSFDLLVNIRHERLPSLGCDWRCGRGANRAKSSRRRYDRGSLGKYLRELPRRHQPKGYTDPARTVRLQGSAARARRFSAGIEREPVLFITAARWFSTVRWLTPRSAAMFLLGCPARTRSMTWRWRTVRPAIELAAVSRQADCLAVSPACSRARSTLASSSSYPIGFSMKSTAPAFIAWTAIGTSPWPVIMIAGSNCRSL